MSALDDNWIQQLELEEGDSLPSAVQKGGGGGGEMATEQVIHNKPHFPSSVYLIQTKIENEGLLYWESFVSLLNKFP